MRQNFDLSRLNWTLEGYTPFVWMFERNFPSLGNYPTIDIPAIQAPVPGSVQAALKQASLLPDWNFGFRSRQCEWIENRHWLYRTHLPDDWLILDAVFRLECLGLDYSGWLYVNGRPVGTFKGTHIPHEFDITSFLKKTDNILEIIFDMPPRWLGQFGYSSKMVEWKPRFNYTWDWTPRLVQIGLWDDISLNVVQGAEFRAFKCVTDADPDRGTGLLEVKGEISPDVSPLGKGRIGGDSFFLDLSLKKGGSLIRQAQYTAAEFEQGLRWENLPVDLWWPNLEGGQPLYTLTCRLVDSQGREHDRQTRRVGFKHVEWAACEGAPVEADPWICVVNGHPVFLQGVNFSPVRSLFADLTEEDYASRLRLYHDLGCNTFRINACQFLEREWFYNLCDELGLMVWQELPLTSSGVENWPPEDESSIAEMADIARSFVTRRQHHVSLLMWSGGNELQGDFEGRKTGIGKPCDANHPMLGRLQEVVQELDPTHRFIPTSPLGPLAGANLSELGQGLAWDVHGPNAAFASLEEAQQYWAADDALFRSEVYCSGASAVALIDQYFGDFAPFPATVENPIWAHPTTWWIDWPRLVRWHGREPHSLEEYVAWSQASQAELLSLGLKATKDRFPRCGGFLLWSGHDTTPMAINSTILDFDGNPKPSAFALSRIWKEPVG